jgi:hypothetical protein
MATKHNFKTKAWLAAAAKLNLATIAALVEANGPIRVIVDANGLGEGVQQAKKRADYEPHTVVFIRNDGWTLGAPAKFEEVARRTWEGSWVGIIRGPVIEDLRL